jgi:hypothetical protein
MMCGLLRTVLRMSPVRWFSTRPGSGPDRSPGNLRQADPRPNLSPRAEEGPPGAGGIEGVREAACGGEAFA